LTHCRLTEREAAAARLNPMIIAAFTGKFCEGRTAANCTLRHFLLQKV
jgi:hypothetical protein